MTDTLPTIDDIAGPLERVGLRLRGGFHPTGDDGAPPDTKTLLLVGNAGPEMWQVFARDQSSGADPLNAWTRRVVTRIAARFDAAPVFPFDGPPYAPFFAWAKRAEAVFDSPIGMLVHPVYGLWHAWRGALAFRGRLALPEPSSAGPPCDSCAGQPCRIACPVDAFREGQYDVAACASHLRTAAGADCLAEGCRARRVCPVGTDYTYAPVQARFHMDAFLRNQKR